MNRFARLLTPLAAGCVAVAAAALLARGATPDARPTPSKAAQPTPTLTAVETPAPADPTALAFPATAAVPPEDLLGDSLSRSAAAVKELIRRGDVSLILAAARRLADAPDYPRQRMAIELIREYRLKDLYPQVTRFLAQEENDLLREDAVALLRRLGMDADRERLHEIFREGTSGARGAAARVLKDLGDLEAHRRFLEDAAGLLSTHPDPGERIQAVLLLQRYGDPAAVDVVALALADRNESVRLEAIRTVGLLGDPAWLQRIGAFRSDSSPAVRFIAEQAVERLRDPSRRPNYPR